MYNNIYDVLIFCFGSRLKKRRALDISLKAWGFTSPPRHALRYLERC